MTAAKIKEINLSIGAEKPFSVVHISDTHLTLSDERNDERKMKLSKARKKVFLPSPDLLLSEAEQYAKDKSLPIVHTGDLIDFVSEANLDRAKKFIDENDVLFIAGNHEFSLYVGEAKEDAEYRNKSLDHVQEAFKNNIRFNSRVINGVNFIGIDNGYYLFEKFQLDLLKREAEKGMPIILYMHNPIFNEDLFEFSFNIHNNTSAYLVGTPDKFLNMGEEGRALQQKPDKTTLEMIAYIKSCPLIKCVLAGHIHNDFEGKLTENLTQIICGKATITQINIF